MERVYVTLDLCSYVETSKPEVAYEHFDLSWSALIKVPTGVCTPWVRASAWSCAPCRLPPELR